MARRLIRAAACDWLFVIVWEGLEASPSVNDDIFLRRFLRRVHFTDAFESADDACWSSSVP